MVLQKQEQMLNTFPFFCLTCLLQLSNALEMLCLALPWSAFPPRCLSSGIWVDHPVLQVGRWR